MFSEIEFLDEFRKSEFSSDLSAGMSLKFDKPKFLTELSRESSKSVNFIEEKQLYFPVFLCSKSVQFAFSIWSVAIPLSRLTRY